MSLFICFALEALAERILTVVLQHDTASVLSLLNVCDVSPQET